MNILMVILTAMSLIISIFCYFSAKNSNEKVQRMRKRYDFLLRGRGDLNLEQLIVEFGKELDELQRSQERTGQTVNQLNHWVNSKETEQNSYVDTRVNGLQTRFQQEVNSLTANMKRLDEQVYARMDQVDKELGGQINELNRSVHAEMQTAARQVNKRMDSDKAEWQASIQSLTEATQAGLKSNQRESSQRWQQLDQQMKEGQSGLQQAMEDYQRTISEDLHSQSAMVLDELSLTLSQVYLYRYNAFENISGDQSFSLVLLNEHGSGVIITSIYSRSGSTIFAKNIKNREPVQNLSPEERKALNQALQRGKG